MDWFERLTGFKEHGYEETRQRFKVVGSQLHSLANQKSYGIGILETPTLKELRNRAASIVGHVAGKPIVSSVIGDIRHIHREVDSTNALFQVASQFNLLEMPGHRVTPEEGVTAYEDDGTQGPACAIAAGAATIYRNYFAPVDGMIGQTNERQIDCLRDVGNALGNEGGALWDMRNGYAMCSATGLNAINHRLRQLDVAGIDALRDKLRIGVHWNVEVTDKSAPTHLVSQAFCSALPVAYGTTPTESWRPFATITLEGAYEATLWAAVLNAQANGSRTVFLTRVGGSAFRNDHSWIHHAIRRALHKVGDVGLDVRLVSRGAADEELRQLVDELQ